MEDALLYTCLSLICLVFAFKYLFVKNRATYKNLPPGPLFSVPIIGHLHLLKPPVHRTFHRLSQKYGPVFSLWFGSRRVVVVSSSSAVEECFTKNDIALADRPRLLAGRHMSYDFTTVASCPYGDHWRNLRRIGSLEIFSSTRLNMFKDIRKDEVVRLLLKLSRDSFQDFAKVEIKPLLKELTFNTIMRMVAGKRFYGDDVSDKEEARNFIEVIEEAFVAGGATNAGDFLPILSWIGLNGYEKKIKRIFKKTDSLLQGLIEEHRRDTTSRNTMIDHLLSMQKSQPEYYTDQIIKGYMLVMLFAGTDTAAVTIEWAMSNLLNHSHILKTARLELDEHVGKQNLVDESDLSKLPYLQNVICETLRLCPAAPMLVPHYSSQDCTIQGYDMPRDTILLVNAWAIQRDPQLWDDPESFRPERFEKGEVEACKLLPFGIGRRACPGMSLAQRVVGLTLGSLIQCFDWERVSHKQVDMAEGVGLTMPKVVPLEAKCKARDIMKIVQSIDEI